MRPDQGTKRRRYMLLLRLCGTEGADCDYNAGFPAKAGHHQDGKGPGGNIAPFARAEKGG